MRRTVLDGIEIGGLNRDHLIHIGLTIENDHGRHEFRQRGDWRDRCRIFFQQHFARTILDNDGVLRICGLSPEGRAMLEMCGLDDLCLAYETREEAIVGSCNPRLPR